MVCSITYGDHKKHHQAQNNTIKAEDIDNTQQELRRIKCTVTLQSLKLCTTAAHMLLT